MTLDHDTLSAFLDGELSPQETQAVEAALAADPALQAELEKLMAADALAQDAFAEMADAPVPDALIAAIEAAPTAQPANLGWQPRTVAWLMTAAAAVALMVGGVGGYMAAGPQTQQVATRGWLADIADYHKVYAAQGRHLVEVPAQEAEHIQTWLTATVGAPVRIPDLSPHGLNFEGARLLVAAGKPVAQLIFTDAEKRVVALCLLQSDAPAAPLGQRTIGGFDMVSWTAQGAGYVVVGDEGRVDLLEIAQTAAQDV